MQPVSFGPPFSAWRPQTRRSATVTKRVSKRRAGLGRARSHPIAQPEAQHEGQPRHAHRTLVCSEGEVAAGGLARDRDAADPDDSAGGRRWRRGEEQRHSQEAGGVAGGGGSHGAEGAAVWEGPWAGAREASLAPAGDGKGTG